MKANKPFAKITTTILFGWTIIIGTALGASTTELPLVHPLFSDHLVLQRNIKVPVWGWTTPGRKVTVAFAGQTKETLAEPDGKWIVRLDAMSASSEGRVMTITAGE